VICNLARPRLCALVAAAVAVGSVSAQAPDRVAETLALRRGHLQRVEEQGQRPHYAKRFDLSALPAYTPGPPLAGTIRLCGSDSFIWAGNLSKYWEEGFRRHHPAVKFEYLKSNDSAPPLLYGLCDLGAGSDFDWYATLRFQDYTDYAPGAIQFATGSFDVPEFAPTMGVFVHRDNPLSGLSLEQLDGIFAAERRGGWEGTAWRTDLARGPERNIRTWGQLGLTGEWKDKPINVYGRALAYGGARTFEKKAFGSPYVKWNERLREYGRYLRPDGTIAPVMAAMLGDLGKDRFGIAYGDLGDPVPDAVKLVPLAAKDGGPYVGLTIDTVQKRTYPLADGVSFQINRAPGKHLDPIVDEYVRYALSREGQEAVQRDGKWLPLTAEIARAELKRVEAAVYARESAESIEEALEVRRGHFQRIKARGEKEHYEERFDLSALPAYKPEQEITGTIRLCGSDYFIWISKLSKYWEEGFLKHHPQAKIEYVNWNDSGPPMIYGLCDLGGGSGLDRRKLLHFLDRFGYAPTAVQFATNSFDVAGWGATTAIFVHKDNPIVGVTLDQLDRIFEAESTGGWDGTVWRPELGRGPETNIRTWGQLGLTGEWKDKPINAYGRALAYGRAGTKWNEKMREYAHDILPGGVKSIMMPTMLQDMRSDRYGMAYNDLGHGIPEGLKAIGVARKAGDPFVMLTLESLRNRTYPLAGGANFQLNRPPGKPLEAKVKEYIRFALSREGQEAVQRDGKWVPLTAEIVQKELKRLE
jgi:ABC-type phosphate transport system substrate-binding protein